MCAGELRAATQALLLAPELSVVANGGAVAEVSHHTVDSLLDGQALVMGLQLALAIDDAPLTAASVQMVYSAITPLLLPRVRTILALPPLCACLESLRLLGASRLASTRRAPHLLACVGFELSRLSTEWGLVRLAEHAAGLDVAGFAAQNEAACIDSGRATDSDTAADKLVGLALRGVRRLPARSFRARCAAPW